MFSDAGEKKIKTLSLFISQRVQKFSFECMKHGKTFTTFVSGGKKKFGIPLLPARRFKVYNRSLFSLFRQKY
jgi:hypothetical protein